MPNGIMAFEHKIKLALYIFRKHLKMIFFHKRDLTKHLNIRRIICTIIM